MTFDMLTTASFGLAIVLALVLAAARLVRALGLAPAQPTRLAAGDARQLRLMETLRLDSRRRLLLARCGEREVLILTGGPQDLLLSMPAAATTEDAAP